jgi:catalase
MDDFQVEKQLFSPANVVPGWAASEDPVLQVRMLTYGDSSVSIHDL